MTSPAKQAPGGAPAPEPAVTALAIVDGDIVPTADATIAVTDEGLLRGDGAFEVVRVYGGRPFALDEHLERMARSAATIRLPIDVAAVRDDARRLLAESGESECALRLLVTRGGRRIGLVEPVAPRPETISLVTVEYSPSRILDGVKSLSYAGNMLATRLAREAGSDEALFVAPDGRVLEGPVASLFVSLDGETLVTPPLSEGILDSITRRHLLDLLPGASERALRREDLASCREAFLAGTTREVQAIGAIDGRPLPAAPGPLTAAAGDAYMARVRDGAPR